MEPITPEAVQAALMRFAGQTVYVHLETTNGAYAHEGSNEVRSTPVSAYIRNAAVQFERAVIAGAGPYRVGIPMPFGWIYAEGLTDWEVDDRGRLLMAGHDSEGRLAIALELSPAPFPVTPAVTGKRDLGPRPEAPGGPAPAPGPERHVLAVFPHPDDETMAAGGTIIMHARAGTPVTCLCGTRGELGRNMGRPFFATRETLPELREQELKAACRILGVSDLRLLGLRDKTVEFEDPDVLAARIRAVIDEIRPSLIITYHPTRAVHPDHNATGAAVIRAVGAMPEAERPAVHCVAFGTNVEEAIGQPDLTVDVSGVFDVKMAAVKAHRSQSEVFLARREAQAARDPAERAKIEAQWKRERFWIWRF